MQTRLIISLLVFLSLSTLSSLTSQSIAIDSRVTTEAVFFGQYSDELGLTDVDEMKELRAFEDKYGWKRTKYQQYHNDYLVMGAVYTLHSKSGLLQKGTGIVVPHLAVTTQVNDLQDQIKELELSRYTEKVNVNPIDTVIMSRSYPDQHGGYALAIGLEVTNENPQTPIREIIYLNAKTGHVIFIENKILHQSTSANAKTKYYGEQEIITQKRDDGRYILRDTTRGAGVVTINGDDRDNDFDYGYADFENDSTNWDWDGTWQNEVSTDAHYCASRYYDWMLEMFGWEGVDGLGGELICINNTAGKFYVNAYWNGTATHYGNGDCANYDPLTTLDVVGHEFAHGFTKFSSGLIYRNQSGALNEAISDIIGKSLEYAYDFDNFDWFIGNRFRINEDAGIFRSMSNPNDRNDTKYYDGNFWYRSAGDNGGVHSNSGLLNYWFYLLAEGQTGVNEVEYSFNVPELGFEKTLDVVYGMQTGYLTENSTFIDAMYSSLEVAKDYWTENSLEYLAVEEAWLAVGLYPTIDDFDLSIESTEDEIYLCPGDEQVTTVIIRNVGRQAYNLSTVELVVALGNDFNIVEILLPQNFNPGDSILVETPLDFALQDGESKDINLVFAHLEGNNLNNKEGIDLNLIGNVDKDLEFKEIIWRLDDECDKTSVEGIGYSILNNGCQIIPQNDSLALHFETPDGIVTLMANVPFDLDPGNRRISTIFINEDEIDLTQVSAVSVEYEGDADPNNNRVLTPEIVSPTTINDGYYEHLEDGSIPQFYIQGSTFATSDSVLTYQNNTVLAVAGRSGSSSFVNCPNREDFYNSNYQKKYINFCTNTIGMTEPEFRFEVLSKTRLVEENADVPFHTMLYIDIPGLDPYLISTESDGVWETQKIKLPVDFEDIITVVAFALSGTASFELPDLNDSDYLLFDNFRLLESSISDVDDQFTANEISLYPNPAQNTINIKGTQVMSKISLNDLSGRIILTKEVNSTESEIDLSNVESGIYLLIVYEGNKITHNQKVVKID